MLNGHVIAIHNLRIKGIQAQNPVSHTSRACHAFLQHQSLPCRATAEAAAAACRQASVSSRPAGAAVYNTARSLPPGSAGRNTGAAHAQAACGGCYAIVPFVSRRHVGIVSGVVSAGGAVGGVINQAIFFLNGSRAHSFPCQLWVHAEQAASHHILMPRWWARSG